MNPFRGTDCTIMRANSNYKLYFITFTENTKDGGGGGGSGHKPGMNGEGRRATFCVSRIIVWWSFGVLALLQIVAISLVDNPRVDIICIGLQLCMETRKIEANPPQPYPL